MPELIEYLFSFEGRVNREKFHIFLISYFVFCAIFNAIMRVVEIHWIIGVSAAFFSTVMYCSFFVRRVHDIGRSGWGFWIPLYNAYIGILALFARGDQGPNQYGEDPLQVVSVQKAI